MTKTAPHAALLVSLSAIPEHLQRQTAERLAGYIIKGGRARLTRAGSVQITERVPETGAARIFMRTGYHPHGRPI